MKLTRIVALFLLSLLFITPYWYVAAQDLDPFPLGPLSPRTGLLLKDSITVKLIQTSSGDLAHDYVTHIAQWDRSQYTPGFDRAAEWVVQKAKEFGLDDVSIERYPSDGKIDYFGNSTQRIWTVKKAELWMTSPFEIRITSYAELPMSLARNSGTTNVEAEVVDVGAGASDDDYKKDVKGKIVLTTGNPGMVIQQAVYKRGAAGIVTSWSVPEFDNLNRLPGDFPDQIGWGAIPQPDEKRPGSFAFLISSRRAQELKTLMRQAKPLRMRAVVDAEFSSGTINLVSGVIPGSKYPNEEIVVTAHLDHYKPGANDNASGSASILEIARTLNQLIEAKQLPRPLRTIRFLWVPEYSGSYAWFSKHLDDPIKRIANLNFDMLGENLNTTNAVFAITYTPDSNPSFLNAVMESILDFMNKYNDERYPPQKDFHIISINGSRNRLQGRMTPYTTGTDHEVFNNAKIPGTGPLGWPDYFYHSSEDRPDKVDPTQLHRVIFIGLGALATLAYADDQDALDVARLALTYGRKRIAVSESEAAGSLFSSLKENFSENEFLAKALVKHVYHREMEAVRSAETFSRTAESRKSIERTAAMLDGDEKTSLKNIEEIASLRSKELGVARTSVTLTDAERRASWMIPVREKGKELYNINYVAMKVAQDTTFQKVGAALSQAMIRMRENGESSLRLMGMADAPAHYADGKQSILEIRDAFAVDYAPMSVDALMLYFQAFEKAGLMKIVEK
jgi:Zn-dependent M28 family amino/carboxypeptidase